jgi:hypothetical protein
VRKSRAAVIASSAGQKVTCLHVPMKKRSDENYFVNKKGTREKRKELKRK